MGTPTSLTWPCCSKLWPTFVEPAQFENSMMLAQTVAGSGTVVAACQSSVCPTEYMFGYGCTVSACCSMRTEEILHAIVLYVTWIFLCLQCQLVVHLYAIALTSAWGTSGLHVIQLSVPRGITLLPIFTKGCQINREFAMCIFMPRTPWKPVAIFRWGKCPKRSWYCSAVLSRKVPNFVLSFPNLPWCLENGRKDSRSRKDGREMFQVC